MFMLQKNVLWGGFRDRLFIAWAKILLKQSPSRIKLSKQLFGK